MSLFLKSIDIVFPDWALLLMAALCSFLFAYFAIPTIVKISRLKGLYDFPSERKAHETATPLLGGLAVFAGFIITATVFCKPEGYKTLFYIFGSLVVLAVVGLKDDILIISPFKKLTGQFLAAAIIVILGDVQITDFHGVFNIDQISDLQGIVFSILLLMLFTVSFNLIDGVDGLASGLAVISSLFYGVWFTLNGSYTYSLISFSLASSLIAFFRYNVFSTSNKIFLGDTGAMITGFVSGVLTIEFLEYHADAGSLFNFKSAPFISIGLFFVPIFDTFRMIMIRIPERNLFRASRNHIHHVVSASGFSHIKTTALLIGLNTLIFSSYLFLQKLGNTFLLFYTLILMLSLFIALQFRLRKILKTGNINQVTK